MADNYIPLVSIIIPAYNRESIIGITLDSVLEQTYKNWECIIIDDGSTDRTSNVINSYNDKDQRFKFLKRQREPKGAPTCRNIGLENAKGDYVIFLDSDDIILSNCIQDRIETFKNNDHLEFIVFPGVVINLVKNTITYSSRFLDEPDINQFLRTVGAWHITAPIYKRKFLYNENISFDEELIQLQDTFFHIESIKKSNGKYLNLKNTVQPDSVVLVGAISRISDANQFHIKNENRFKFGLKCLKLIGRSNNELLKNIKSNFIHIVILLLDKEKKKTAFIYHKKLIKLKIFSTKELVKFTLVYFLYSINFQKINGFYQIRKWLLYKYKLHAWGGGKSLKEDSVRTEFEELKKLGLLDKYLTI
jgi:glycosyltransferase involved in cell wall biosynthesis